MNARRAQQYRLSSRYNGKRAQVVFVDRTILHAAYLCADGASMKARTPQQGALVIPPKTELQCGAGLHAERVIRSRFASLLRPAQERLI
jgi:hypothetical protein